MKRFGIGFKPLFDMAHIIWSISKSQNDMAHIIWVRVKTKKSQIFAKSQIKNLKVEMKKIQNRI